MGRLKDQPERFSFDAAVRVLTFLRRRADPAAAARFTSTTGSSYLPAEVTQVQVDAGIAEPLVHAPEKRRRPHRPPNGLPGGGSARAGRQVHASEATRLA